MGASGTKPGGSSDPASAPPSEPPTPKAGTAAVRPAVGGGADADGRKTVNRAGGGVASLGSASDNHLAGLAGLLAPGLTPVISWGRAGGYVNHNPVHHTSSSLQITKIRCSDSFAAR